MEYFSMRLELLNKTSISKILNRSVEKQEDLLVFQVHYNSEDSSKHFTWEIYKKYRDIKDLLIIVLILTHF